VEDLDYFIVARPLRINKLKEAIGRSLQCVDRYGHQIEITLWKEYDEVDIEPNETYRFGKLKAKLYRGQVSLQSRKRLTTIQVS
jgi:hypothetical protein